MRNIIITEVSRLDECYNFSTIQTSAVFSTSNITERLSSCGLNCLTLKTQVTMLTTGQMVLFSAPLFLPSFIHISIHPSFYPFIHPTIFPPFLHPSHSLPPHPLGPSLFFLSSSSPHSFIHSFIHSFTSRFSISSHINIPSSSDLFIPTNIPSFFISSFLPSFLPSFQSSFLHSSMPSGQVHSVLPSPYVTDR